VSSGFSSDEKSLISYTIGFVMNIHPSFTTSSRQVIGVILETNYFEDIAALIRLWADKYQFVFENTESNLGPIFKLSHGINRQKFIKHEIKLGKLGSNIAMVVSSVSKGHPIDPFTHELMNVISAFASLKPKHVRNDIGPVEDGVKFINNIKAHLIDKKVGLPFILILPTHDLDDSPELKSVLVDSDDIDVIRIGRKTKAKIRELGYKDFCKGQLLLHIPSHETKVMPIEPSASGLREAVTIARAHHARLLEKILVNNVEADVIAGNEHRPHQHSSWTVEGALLKTWSVHSEILELNPNALDTATKSNYHDPEWVYDSLNALCLLAKKWKAGESLGGNWEQTMKSHGYDFSPRSSANTLGKCIRHYQFTHEGKTIVADAHLGRGNQGSKNVIRIYLHRDEERKMLVVCHVGNHLPTGSQTT
jgi:hypothetical protein